MIPSGSRLVPIYEGQPQPFWPAKDPSNIRIYGADFTRVLCGAGISSVSAAATPPVLPSLCTVIAPGIVGVALSGGEDGQLARVEITVTLNDGETDTRAIMLPICAQGILEGTPMSVSPVTTNDATPTVIGTYTVAGLPGTAVDVQGPVLARNVATGDACSFDVAAVFQNVGLANVSASFTSITAPSPPEDMAGCNLAMQAAGNTITLIATGLAGQQIVWTPNLTMTVA